MPNFADLDLQTLMDLLVKYTTDYTRMLCSGEFTEEEFSQCKQTLADLQKSIKLKTGKEAAYDLTSVRPDFPDYIFDLQQNPAFPASKAE